MMVISLKRWMLVVVCWLVTTSVFAQANPDQDMKWVDSVLTLIRSDQSLDSETKSTLSDSAFQICARHHNLCKQINARVIQATYLDDIGMLDSALTQLYWAQRFFQPSCDSLLLMSLYRNLTSVYLSLEELDRVDSVSKIALAHWNPTWKVMDGRLGILNNLGIAQAMKGNNPSATTTFHQMYQESRADQNPIYIEKALINLGSLKGIEGDLDSAYYFIN